ncbi:unnamed protein product [Didymodactylos carnosus]|uniref:Uncharacterized protein n=2 Tax=Didymodactylos carnosus TaxID=1234261 RepID=A0A814YEI7_9BILA|nr:unnamed protein product [Didymodactylos carnosus]CAF3990899.1 unnamed protein product [Didymodactylos carnosus]
MSSRYCLIMAVLFFTTLWLCACVATPFWRTTPIVDTKTLFDLGTLGRTFPIIQSAVDSLTRKIQFEIKVYTGILYSCLYFGRVGDLEKEVNDALNGQINGFCGLNKNIRMKLLDNDQLAGAITGIPTGRCEFFAGLISMLYSFINVVMFMTINSYSSYGFIIGQICTLILTLWSLSHFVNYQRRQRERRQDGLDFIQVKT